MTSKPSHVQWTKFAWWMVILCLILIGRVAIVQQHVAIHNDEIHYTTDGMWARAKLPLTQVLWGLLYNHIHPHPFYNPKTEEIGYHGKLVSGFPKPRSNLGPHPRTGHPSLYMLILGPLFMLFDQAWLIGKGSVYVGRAVSAVFDTLGWLFFLDAMRRLVGARIALTITAAVLLWPYTFVLGVLAYLDSLGTFFVNLSLWYYVSRVRHSTQLRQWALLGVLVGFAILSKQSNLIAIPPLLSVILIAPPRMTWRRIVFATVCSFVTMIITVSSLCNPVGLYVETRYPEDPAMDLQVTPQIVLHRLTLPFHPKDHYHFGERRHGGWDNKPPPVRSKLMVKIYEITTPAFFLVFYLAVIYAAVRRKWKALLLALSVIWLLAYIPMGSCMRRAYVLMPFATLVIALAIRDVCDLRRGAIQSNHSSPEPAH